MAIQFMITPLWAGSGEDPVTFRIRRFAVQGNTLLPEEEIDDLLWQRRGFRKTIDDVEEARAALEKLYHEAGYPAVLVNLPEQTTENGVIRLEVTESRIERVKVGGNRFVTREKLLRDLSSFRQGGMLYLPSVQKDLERVNRDPDVKVAPVLMPGKEPGTIDVELKVKDRLPLHGSLELNNLSSHDTTRLRLNGSLSFDNLWQRGHSLSLQYQTSPQDTGEVQVGAFSYTFPSPWNREHLVAAYGIFSDSDVAFGQGFQVIGKGRLAGIRYVVPLPTFRKYDHHLTFGLDYKDFDDTLGFSETGEQDLKTPITYLPFSLSYVASLPDPWGSTRFNAGLNLSLRGLVSNPEEFAVKRFKARGSYVAFTAGLNRSQKLPWGFQILWKMDGQVADQPLISNEQYSAGGMESVRGYLESEELGDDAVHTTLELATPDLGKWLNPWKGYDMTLYGFYDGAKLRTKDPLPQENDSITLQGTGVGIRGHLVRNVEYEVDWAVPLDDSSRIDRGEKRVDFRVKYAF